MIRMSTTDSRIRRMLSVSVAQVRWECMVLLHGHVLTFSNSSWTNEAASKNVFEPDRDRGRTAEEDKYGGENEAY